MPMPSPSDRTATTVKAGRRHRSLSPNGKSLSRLSDLVLLRGTDGRPLGSVRVVINVGRPLQVQREIDLHTFSMASRSGAAAVLFLLLASTVQAEGPDAAELEARLPSLTGRERAR